MNAPWVVWLVRDYDNAGGLSCLGPFYPVDIYGRDDNLMTPGRAFEAAVADAAQRCNGIDETTWGMGFP